LQGTNTTLLGPTACPRAEHLKGVTLVSSRHPYKFYTWLSRLSRNKHTSLFTLFYPTVYPRAERSRSFQPEQTPALHKNLRL